MFGFGTFAQVTFAQAPQTGEVVILVSGDLLAQPATIAADADTGDGPGGSGGNWLIIARRRDRR